MVRHEFRRKRRGGAASLIVCAAGVQFGHIGGSCRTVRRVRSQPKLPSISAAAGRRMRNGGRAAARRGNSAIIPMRFYGRTEGAQRAYRGRTEETRRSR